MVRLTVADIVSERSAGRLLRAVNRQLVCFGERRFERSDLSFINWLALKVVYDGTVQTAGDLARELRMTTGATTRLIDVLERRGFLKRSRCQGDRRVINLSVCPGGAARMLEMAPLLAEAWNEVLADFDDVEFLQLTKSLEKLLLALGTNHASGEPYDESLRPGEIAPG